MSFEKRESRPEKGNKFYITKESGGYSPCIEGKMKSTGKPDKDCNTLPNCVGYVWGRFHEVGNDPKFTYWCRGNAEDIFIKADKALERSLIPKVGSIMCFRKGNTGDSSDGAGHVLFVEEVYDDDDILISDSGYNTDDVFRLTRRQRQKNGNWGLNEKYTFQGFVYNPFVKEESDEDRFYIVKKGDTLSSIARKYNTTYKKLAAFNQIRNPNLIYSGQKIWIPKEIEYTVKAGDTLWRIGVNNHISYTIIAAYNDIPDPSKIDVNDKILIPKRKE